MTVRRDVPFWSGPVVAGVLGVVLASAQVTGALAIGALNFDRRFDAGSDNDWLLNHRGTVWFCATAVVVAVLLTRVVLDSPVWAAVVAAALGVGTVVPYLTAQAGRAQHLYLVDSASASIAEAAIVGVAVGVVTSLIVSRLAASARVPASGAVAGAAVVWILLGVSANAIAIDPPVLGALELELDYGARVDTSLGSALLVGPVIAALVCLLVRRESTATLVVAGLLTVSTVAAAILATALAGPTPSGDHGDVGLSVLGPLLLGGLLAYGLLTAVARYRGRNRQTEASVVAGSPE
ncbi:hypothetical protein [Catellatospora citrea]|uniref:Uncharacterized protein n=1 Tax=Catellatospora citrea TaxID=53366 RepID=A0A8J3NZ81_9ACTN|nr:hypothetical protein [Catellatospora citrea]RKE05270.1 hypothetical protein C8E86_0065 [Catellatospora citrea]GIF98200.1 hypothetical protein Cci01nite_32940 [Catellatospora citrea]